MWCIDQLTDTHCALRIALLAHCSAAAASVVSCSNSLLLAVCGLQMESSVGQKSSKEEVEEESACLVCGNYESCEDLDGATDGEMNFLTEFVPLEAGEEVLSDVHMNCVPSASLEKSGTVVSRFVFTIPDVLRPRHTMPKDGQVFHAGSCQVDDVTDEGDLEIERQEVPRDVMVIEHSMATVLEKVGTQVWRGALYLCDFILGHPCDFVGRTILELGAGVGLVSVLLRYVGASHVFSTDCSVQVLDVCRRNVEGNHVLNASRGSVRVRQLDWLHKTFPKEHSTDTDLYTWTTEDVEVLSKGFSVVAADVIYSDVLTDAFLTTLLLLSDTFQQTMVVHLALEKRVNFTLEDLAVSSPPHRHFEQRLKDLAEGEMPRLNVQRLPDTFPQFFQYERVPELELWRLTILPGKNQA